MSSVGIRVGGWNILCTLACNCIELNHQLWRNVRTPMKSLCRWVEFYVTGGTVSELWLHNPYSCASFTADEWYAGFSASFNISETPHIRCVCFYVFLYHTSEVLFLFFIAGFSRMIRHCSWPVPCCVNDDLTLPQPQWMMGRGAAQCVWAEGKSVLRRPHDSCRLTLFKMIARLAACHAFTNNCRERKEKRNLIFINEWAVKGWFQRYRLTWCKINERHVCLILHRSFKK